jgi:hypothetical protein
MKEKKINLYLINAAVPVLYRHSLAKRIAIVVT